MTSPSDIRDRLPDVQSHLEFYEEHGISPVSQDIRDLDAHFQRRESLYRMLGLLPPVFRNGAVLEVGPGSGHNSLWIASLGPKRYDLLEPNTTAVREIGALYDRFDRPHTRPSVINRKLEDFAPDIAYDVVICEGWLGGNRDEQALMKKLSGFVAPGGVLVVTYLPPTGVFVNMIRRLIARRLDQAITDFQARTDVLCAAFGAHLNTMTHMSRPHADWVQDNLINPALLWQPLTPPAIFANLGDAFQAYGGTPHFHQEWRWYKSLIGDGRDYNGPYAQAHFETAHNLTDYRSDTITRRDPARNQAFEDACVDLIAAIAAFEAGNAPDIAPAVTAVEQAIAALGDAAPEVSAGAREAVALLRAPDLSAEDVAAMEKLKPIFGREMCYLSLTRQI